MLIIFTLTMFLSATLLFLVQPMFARMVLPLLGGSPAVWNTAMVFYQTLLLAGYLYAHLITQRLKPQRQALLQSGLVLLPILLLSLPIQIPADWTPPAGTNPIPWLLLVMAVTVGLPFFVVATTSPLLQAWFARTGHRDAADPYFLYAASNIGSMLALLSYPALVEPGMALYDQTILWMLGYVLLLLLVITCGLIVTNRVRAIEAGALPAASAVRPAPQPDHQRGAPRATPLSPLRRARWVLLAAVPSSLMLSVTTYLSTNIATMPLLWVIPLALYLLTFVIVFAKRPLIPHRLMVRALPILLLPLLIAVIAQASDPLVLLFPLHLATFFVAAMVCHGELAADRPAATHLTEFYLWMSVGGAVGGIVNALLAPLLFATVVEYPLALALVGFLLPVLNSSETAQPNAPHGAQRTRRRDLALPLGLGVLTAALIVGVPALGIAPGPLRLALVFGLPMLLCFSFSRRPLRFGLGLAAILLASVLYQGDQGRLLYAERSFFGVSRVLLDHSGQYRLLAHGSTLHGTQSIDPARAREPLTYYYANGPLGQLFERYRGPYAPQRIAAVGLGVGSVACYRQPDQEWTFYEIDPVVVRIAADPRFFSFMQECAGDASVVLGDARLSLAGGSAAPAYDLMIMDAYSSDAIPVHLLTREALALYLSRLAPDGILAFHISNRYLDLAPVLATLAADADLTGLIQRDLGISRADSARGKRASEWVVLARNDTALRPLSGDTRWQPLVAAPATPLWTDDYSSLLRVLR